MKKKFIEIKNIQIAYYQYGDAINPPMIFCHGNGFHALMFDWYAEKLSKAYCVYLIDWPGHGDSGEISEKYSFTLNGKILLEFIEKLKFKKVVAVGHSMGASAIWLASKQKPDFFDKVIALDPVVLGWFKTFYLLFFMNPLSRKVRHKRFEFPNIEKAIQIYNRSKLFKGWSKVIKDVYVKNCFRVEKNNTVLKCKPSTEISYFNSFSVKNYWNIASKRKNALVLFGEKSNTCNMRLANKMAQSVIDVPNGDHFFAFCNNEFVFESIDCFLQPALLVDANKVRK